MDQKKGVYGREICWHRDLWDLQSSLQKGDQHQKHPYRADVYLPPYNLSAFSHQKPLLTVIEKQSQFEAIGIQT